MNQITIEKPIEITDEMVEAGTHALKRYCPFDIAFPVGGEEAAVEAIYLAMEIERLAQDSAGLSE